MKEDKKVPQLRFPEFTDAWKQCKLSDLVNVIDGDRGKNYPTEADFEPHGHTLFLNASNVTIDGFLFDTNQFITEEKSNSMGSGKIIKDDIIITSRGSLGHIAWYNDSVQQVMPHLRINSGMLILRNKANVKTSYLHQFMKSDKGKAQIVFMSFGSAQPQLTKKGVESFTVNYPIDTEEQIKIGAFFSKLDNTITLQQRKLNSLQKLKKGLLQKMFPKNGENIPEIRFPEFSDAWKQCKLSDLVNVIDGDRGKNYPTEADFEPHGHTLFLNASNVTIDGFLFDTNQFITEEKSNSMGSGKIIKDDIIITSRGSLGHIAWYNDSVQQVMPHLRINSGMLILRNKANVKTSYLHQFMKSDKGKAQIVFMSFGSAQPQLTKKGVESFTVNYPIDTEEQIKIGAFFSKLDNTITLQQRKLESLQKLKKGLLQQMFI